MNEKEVFELFESCLEWKGKTGGSNLEAASRFPEYKAELLELLELADQVKQNRVAGPRPEFTAVARTRMINQIRAQERSKARAVVTKDKSPRHIRQNHKMTRRLSMTWIIVISLLATALAGGGGVAYASADALPGDTLYPVKTAIQDLELTFASDEADVDLLLDHMAENIQDMEKLAQQGRYDDIETGLDDYLANLQEFTQTRSRVSYDDAGSEDSINQRLQIHTQALTNLQQQLQTQDKLQTKLQTATQLTDTGNTYGPNDGGKPDEPGEPNGAGPAEPGNKPVDAGNGTDNGQGQNDDPGSGGGQGQPVDSGSGSGQGAGCQMTADGEVCSPEDIGYTCSQNGAGELECKADHPENGAGAYLCEKDGDGSIICKPDNSGNGQNGQGGDNGSGSGSGGKP